MNSEMSSSPTNRSEAAIAADLDSTTVKARLEAMLSASVDSLVRYPSGFSWITYGFKAVAPNWRDGTCDYILRIGPSDGLFAPYSAAPQFHALKLLDGTAVAAPRVYGWSDDIDQLGAPWFVSEKARGDAPIPWGGDGMDDATRHALGCQFADQIAELHTVDWQGSDLAAIEAVPTVATAAAVQVDRWEADYRRWRLRPHPMVHRALAWLRERLPIAPRVSVIHGDYRLGNFLAVGNQITALLDWELVHLGDPHEDLAWACLPQYRGGTKLMSKLIAREELYERYSARTGFAVNADAMEFYTVFSLLKLAITHMAAVHAFERRGFSDMRMPAMGTQIAPVLRQIEKAIAQ
jgi:aminoglycoside phosphotransferase (APT) family kinase protein